MRSWQWTLHMLRQRVMNRDEAEYTAWAAGPLRTIGAGIADCDWQSAETTPPRFFLCARRVEAHLRRVYVDSLENASHQTDEVSMMERTGQDRHRPRSRLTTRGRGTGSSGARVTEEVRHLGGGRASGSRSGHLGDRPLPLPKRRPDSDRVTACPKRTHRRAGSGGTRREATSEPWRTEQSIRQWRTEQG